MRTRSGLYHTKSNDGYDIPVSLNYIVGKVYATIIDENSVPSEVWEANGQWGGVGTIIYQKFEESNEISLNNLDDSILKELPTAIPMHPHQKYYPLPGEIVLLFTLPSALPAFTNKAEETYYISVINAWNNPQFNGLFLEDTKSILYDSFKENPEVTGLQPFKGDNILEGRFGHSIRLGSTNKSGRIDLNPWSTNSSEIDNNPIILISNKHGNKNDVSNLFIEDINKDGASLYLTSRQTIPLDTGNVKLSNITNPISIKKYSRPQAILNADRVIISSKSDEVMVFGKSAVEMYSQGSIYMQSNKVGITLQDNNIFLGPVLNSQNTQPLILGDDLKLFLSELLKILSDFSTNISNATSTPEGTPLLEITSAASSLQTAIENAMNKLSNMDYMVSKTTFTC